jgi:hypothetical protein
MSLSVLSALNSWPLGVLLKQRHCRVVTRVAPDIAPVLVQDHGNDLSARIVFELELSVDLVLAKIGKESCPVICASR